MLFLLTLARILAQASPRTDCPAARRKLQRRVTIAGHLQYILGIDKRLLQRLRVLEPRVIRRGYLWSQYHEAVWMKNAVPG